MRRYHLILIAAALLAGCGGNNTYNPTFTGGGPVVSISISPTTATIQVNQTQAFTATVTGASDTSVTWSVQGGSANGTITQGGVYTAPATPGTYTVIVTSNADTSKTATATVTVTAAPPTTGNLNGTIQ